MNALDDPFYWELVPSRPTPPESGHMADGPTARWLALKAEQEKWQLIAEIGDDDEAAVA